MQALIWKVQQLQGRAGKGPSSGGGSISASQLGGSGISLALPGLASAPGPHELVARTPATVLAQAARRAEESQAPKTSQSISEHLVSFDDLDALREKHRQLLRVVRVLAEQRAKEVRATSSAAGGAGSSQLLGGEAGVVAQLDPRAQQALRQAAQKLAALQSEREKQQRFLAGIVQQRDMYRALAKSEGKAIGDHAGAAVGAAKSTQDADAGALLVGGHDAAHWKRESEALRARLDQERASAQQALDGAEREAEQARARLVTAQEECKFQRDAVRKLKAEIDELQSQLRAERRRLSEAQARTGEQEERLAVKDQALARMTGEVANEKARARRFQGEAELLRAAEERLRVELKSVGEERAKQERLADQLRRLEEGLQARQEGSRKAADEERSRLAQDLRRAQAEADRLRQEKSDDAKVHAKEL